MEKRVVFRSAWLPYALVAPQIAITIVFFFWPAAQAVWYSFQLQDAFGLKTQFVGLQNFAHLFRDGNYLASFRVTAVFSVLVAFFGLAISLLWANVWRRDRTGARGARGDDHQVRGVVAVVPRRGAAGDDLRRRGDDEHLHLRRHPCQQAQREIHDVLDDHRPDSGTASVRNTGQYSIWQPRGYPATFASD